MRSNPVVIRSVVCLSLLLTYACSAAAVVGQESEKESPRLIRGQVVEADKSAIADAQIRWTLISWNDSFEDRKVHAKGSLKSDKDGRFEWKVDEVISIDRSLFLNVTLGTKSHFARSFDFGSTQVFKETVDVGELTLERGVRVKWQLLSPDGSSTKLEYPSVSMHSDDGLEYGSRQTFFYRDLECDSDGKFECLVPNNQTLELKLQAENFAQTDIEKEIKVEVPADKNEIAELDLGSIRLKAGVSIVGTAKLRDGSPAKGVVVAVGQWAGKGSSIQTKSDRFEYQQVGHIAFAKTDEQGNFRFPPHQGKCTVLALQNGSSRKIVDGERQVLQTDGMVPFFEPVDVDLDGKGREVIVKLSEAETVEISGTVYDAKGKPVPDARIRYSWNCIFGPIDNWNTRTDKNGQYKIRMGKGFRPEIDLRHDGREKAVVTAETVEEYPELFFGSGQLESPEFNVVTKDVDQLNWELLPSEKKSGLGRAVKWWFSEE